jgi:hypothetical protein
MINADHKISATTPRRSLRKGATGVLRPPCLVLLSGKDLI